MIEALALVMIKPIFASSPLDTTQPKIPDPRIAPVRRTAVLLTTDKWHVLLGPLRSESQEPTLTKRL